jgi:hypothetical protein
VAKLTVYIPDDLLDRARALNEDANTSQLVQRGLERLVGAASAYAQRPADADMLLSQAHDRLAPAAAAEYERGYRAALVTVDTCFWPLLDQLARQEFDLFKWARAWVHGMGSVAAGVVPGVEQGFSPPEWFSPLARDLGSLVDPIGVNEFSFTPTRAFVHGYERALRDAWEAVEHPSTEAEAPDRA